MFRRRAFWISLIFVLALAGGGGYAYYRIVYLPGQEPVEQAIITGQVSRGDLIVSVSGSGTLVPAAEIELGFQSGGYLDQVLVDVGDRVQEGDVLARLERGPLELAVAEADIDARLAQLDLDDAREGPSDAELADARAAVQNAQSALLVAQYTYDSALNSGLDSAVRARLIEFEWYVDQAWEADERREEGAIGQEDYAEAWDERGAAEGRFNEALHGAEMEDLDAWNQVDQAQNNLYQAQENLELLQSGPATDTIVRAELSADQAALALADARADLEAADLRAPFDATVVDVAAMPGEYVGTASFITLADLEAPVLQFWVEESDMEGVQVGNRVEIVFEALHGAEMEDLDAWNQVDQAQNNLYQAQESLELLQSGPTTDTIMRAELSADQAALALADARADLEAADLRAPFDATVVDVTAMPGEYVGTASFITLADLEAPVLQFWVEESDMEGVQVGNRVEIVFEALPDDTFTGEVFRVEPALVTVDNTLAVQAWASVDLTTGSANLFGGMNAEVEVISAESRDTLLVPIQALRELGPGQYAVFVVQPDGEMSLRPVEVGLQDFVNAEILSGLEVGEVVSLGVEESTETDAPEQMEPPPMPGMRMFGG